jgi:type IV secretion system protein TrbL
MNSTLSWPTRAGLAVGEVPHGQRVEAFSLGSLNPLNWLGTAANAAVGDVWKAAMTALWSAGLWVLGLAFQIIDAFTTPDLSTSGPLAAVLPYTFAIGAFVAAVMAFTQIGAALYRRDGRSIARVMVGVGQFGAVWIGYIAIAATLVTATSGLTKGLLEALLHIDAFSGFAATTDWPDKIDDTVVATVLGLCTVFLIFPAAIGYVLIMLVREAALLILVCTSPIAAGGLLAEGTRAWFWKSMRWFIATLLISPLAALVLGIGVQISEGTIQNPDPTSTTAQVGMAVTGSILILIGAICPLILFRLLAFVDPGTSSGAAMRQSFAANGGLAAMLGGKAANGGGESAGSGAATRQSSGGRSAGEASADTQTASRFSSMLGGAGQIAGAGMQMAGGISSKATAIGSDVLGAAGVGHQAPYFGSDDPGRQASDGGQQPPGQGNDGGDGAGPGTGPDGRQSSDGGSPSGGSPSGGGGGEGIGGKPPTPSIPTPPTSAGAMPPGSPAGGGAGNGSATADSAGGVGGGGPAAATEAVPIVPV